MNEGFNKSEFSRFLAERVGVSQDVAAILFDEIGQKMSRALRAGNTVNAFGVGTLKVVKKKSADEEATRIRFRPTTRKPRPEAIVTLQDLAGLKSGTVDAVVITSASAGVKAINGDRACQFDGPAGSLTVYRDDAGSFRCVMQRDGMANDEHIVTFKSDAIHWLRETFRIVARAPSP